MNKVEVEKCEVEENLCVCCVFDCVVINIMIVDFGNNIIYMNEVVFNMMKIVESDLWKDLLNFNSNNLIG